MLTKLNLVCTDFTISSESSQPMCGRSVYYLQTCNTPDCVAVVDVVG